VFIKTLKYKPEMADSVSHNTCSKGAVVSNAVLGAGAGGAQAFPSSGRDDIPGLTQTPTQTLSFHRRRRTERGPSMFGAQGPQAAPDVSNTGPKGTRASPTIQGTGASSVNVTTESRYSTIRVYLRFQYTVTDCKIICT